LPSWNDGPAKSSIVDFVTRTTTAGSRDWVPVPERIATFDNDGTLWTEQPMYVQTIFAVDRIKAMAARHPEWRATEPFRSVLADDRAQLAALSEKGMADVVAATHSGITTEEFRKIVLDWLATARHPRFNRPYTDLVFQPMLELLAWLRANQFKTYIVSGGGIDLIRAFSEEAYDIPREQVIGSSVKLRFEVNDGHAELVKLAELNSFDDREVKPQNIGLHIGRRPILAFGNSDGDLAMLRYTKTGRGARLALLIHHDDSEREVAYDREFRLSPLTEALDKAAEYGITVVSMKRDWKAVFDSNLA
jgi:phosphoglycolate phosphatase-like HAD superfamily hydrolase